MKVIDLKKQLILRLLTNNLGKVEETENEIICNVSNKYFYKGNDEVNIYCSGIDEDYENLAKKYNIDKKICYIFDGNNIGESYKSINIKGMGNCEIIIRNVCLDNLSSIYVAGKCVIEDSLLYSSDCFSISAKELILNNVICENYRANTGYIISSRKMTIKDSKIGYTENDGNIFGDKINITNSTISGSIIELQSDELDIDSNSCIKVSNKLDVQIENYNCDYSNFSAPKLIFNGREYDEISPNDYVDAKENKLRLFKKISNSK